MNVNVFIILYSLKIKKKPIDLLHQKFEIENPKFSHYKNSLFLEIWTQIKKSR